MHTLGQNLLQIQAGVGAQAKKIHIPRTAQPKGRYLLFKFQSKKSDVLFALFGVHVVLIHVDGERRSLFLLSRVS